MGRTIYVIVHEDTVIEDSGLSDNRFADYRERAEKVLAEINRIKRMHPKDIFMVRSDRSPELLPQGIPEPSSFLEVYILGAQGSNCVNSQYKALRKAGYNARYCWEGIYDTGCQATAFRKSR